MRDQLVRRHEAQHHAVPSLISTHGITIPEHISLLLLTIGIATTSRKQQWPRKQEYPHANRASAEPARHSGASTPQVFRQGDIL